MGYRSDVAYSISFCDDADLHAFIAQAKALSDTAVSVEDQVVLSREGFHGSPRTQWGRMDLALNEVGVGTQKMRYQTPFIAFYAEGWKWYEGNMDVDAHESLFELAIANYFSGGHKTKFIMGTTFIGSAISCDFLRIGEDSHDVTMRQLGTSRMNGSFGVKRSIWRTPTFDEIAGDV